MLLELEETRIISLSSGMKVYRLHRVS